MFKRIRNIHFVGIGGSGMSGIAEVLLNLGYSISGSDVKETDVTRRLHALGAKIFYGHAAANIEKAHVVVTSTAVSVDNPEVVAAKTEKIPVIPRIEMLAEIARLKYTIAIGGTHGKTTTTSMVASVLQAGGLDPTVVVGGRLKHFQSGAHLGKGDFLVAEADESDGSFLKLSPTLSIITNIDNDHLDYYGTIEKIADAFVQYANHVPFYGCAVVCLDDAAVRAQLPRMVRRVVTYGTRSDAQWQAHSLRTENGGGAFEVVHDGQTLGAVRLQVPGKHNVLNALAAVVIGHELGLSFSVIAQGLAAFDGVGRRMELKGESQGMTVIDDYGHHPTEIKATLAALRERYPKNRLVVLFQPHRYTRTQSLAKEFAESFGQADKVFVLDIYAAGEKPIAGVSSDSILRLLKQRHADAQTLTAPIHAAKLRELLKAGDVVLTLGAGDVWKLGEQLLEASAAARA